MDSSVSPKDEIWFLCVCHHISNAVYLYVRVLRFTMDVAVPVVETSLRRISGGPSLDSLTKDVLFKLRLLSVELSLTSTCNGPINPLHALHTPFPLQLNLLGVLPCEFPSKSVYCLSIMFY